MNERSQKIQWFKEFYRLDRFSNPNEPYLPSATDISYDDLLWLVKQAEKAERYKNHLLYIQKHYGLPSEPTDFVPVTVLHEIQMIVSNALKDDES